MSRSLREPRFGVWHLVWLLPGIAVVLAARRPVSDNSYLWHIRAGELQADLGRVLTTDPFSFTAFGEPWRTQSWLAELAYHWVDARWGLALTFAWILGPAAITVVALGMLARRYTANPLVVANYLILTTLAAVALLNPRPVIFSFALLALLALTLEDGRLRWTAPLIMWVWASVHGSFPLGLGYMGLLYLAKGELWRRRVDVIAALGATLVTAHGWGTWEVVWRFVESRDALAQIREWGTPDLLSLPFLPLLVGFILLIVGAMRGALGPRELWLIIPFIVFGVSANRALLPAWTGITPFVVRCLDGILPFPSARGARPAVNATLATVIVALPWLIPRPGGIDEERFPVSAAAYLSAVRVFHDDGTGGYLIYSQHPQRLVYVDDRAELYGAELFLEFRETRAGKPLWDEVFGKYEIDEALLGRDDALAEVLRLAGWVRVYEDADWVLLRSPAAE